MEKSNLLKVALAQIAPVWLNKEQTLKKIESYISEVGNKGAELVVFGEGLLPGYPFWVALTDGAAWDSTVQKELHAHYIRNSVQIEKGDLDGVCKLAKEKKIAIYLGIIERAQNRGSHSLYATLSACTMKPSNVDYIKPIIGAVTYAKTTANAHG